MGGVVKVLSGKKKKAPEPEIQQEPEQAIQPIEATREERASAAAMRARRGGRRALLSAGRLGGGTEGGQTTLGAG